MLFYTACLENGSCLQGKWEYWHQTGLGLYCLLAERRLQIPEPAAEQFQQIELNKFEESLYICNLWLANIQKI